MSEKATGGISVETKHIFPIIKKWLYSEKEIFLRELVSNACDAVTKLKRLSSLGIAQDIEGAYRITVSLDTENYRAKREEALRKLAVRMANRAKKSGRRVALEPMNPNERRILHSALQNDPEVTTHSEGEEPYRRVIITLR